MRRRRLVAGALGAALLACGAVLRAQPAQPPALPAGVPESSVAGMAASAPQKFTFIGFHVYDATLYVDRARFNVQRLADSRFALALRYARSLVGEKIAERSDSEIEALGIGTPAERAQWLAAMKRLFPDVKAGDVLTGVYEGGRSSFFYNGRLVGHVDGARFGEAFFGIWLHEKTSAPGLRRALLESVGATGAEAR
jgi:hypothetical protein